MTPPVVPVFCSGATGYIGGGILRALAAAGVPAFGGLRAQGILPPGVTPCATGDLTVPGFVLPPVRTVIHAAGLGHKRGVTPIWWRRQNVETAVNLARAARAAGAARFILISTAYVHGRIHAGLVTDTTPPNPMDDYAQSKLEAEWEVAAAFGPGVTIIRPAAVIGPACPGNIQLLLKCLARGMPLPLGGITNRRAFIHRDDLAAIVLAVCGAVKPPESVLAAHPESIGTTALIEALARGLGRPARLFECPAQVLATLSSLVGRGAMWQSLAGDFAANPAAALGLGWRPAQSLAESLEDVARYYITTRRSP